MTDTIADQWNAAHPVGTPVHAWPIHRGDPPMITRTRTPAWTLGHGAAVVSVEGYAGGISLTHIEPRDGNDTWPHLDPAPTGKWTVDPREVSEAEADAAREAWNQEGHDTAGPHHDYTADPW
jgi:hypothetical protein